MKRLYIIRHAKSSWDSPELSDFDRPLNRRGLKAAPFMGDRLKKFEVMPDMILSSPALRAATTAKIIAQQIGYPESQIQHNKDIYEASLKDIVHIISSIPDNIEQLFFVGHNPGLTEAANYLSNAQVPNMPTASIFCIGFEMDSWHHIGEQTGQFIFFDYPKKHDPQL